MLRTVRLFVLVSLGFGSAPSVSGQSAYFSLEGGINVPIDEYDAMFDLTRAVGSGEDLRFRAYTQVGGVNSAGDVIPSSGFDGQLSLFDSGNTLRGQDRSSAGPDALLSWPGISFATPTPLSPDPLPVDSYRLNIAHSMIFGSPVGPFAVDLIGPADALVFTGGAPVNNATLASLKFGSTGGGTATYRLDADLTADYLIEVQESGLLIGNGANASVPSGASFIAPSGGPGRIFESAGTLGLDVGGAFQLNGGTGGNAVGGFSTAGMGGVGGEVVIAAGSANLSGTVDLVGGNGGSDPFGTGADAGRGGRLTISGGTIALNGQFNLVGGVGGAITQGAGGPGRGGSGGSFNLSSGMATVSGAINLLGGEGGRDFVLGAGGVGGNGGVATVSGGTLVLDGGNITLTGGIGGVGPNGLGPAGANGSVNVTGGTLTLDTGAILGRNGVASADPLTIANADLNISGGDVIVNNPITVSGGGADINLSGGTFTATTVREAAGGDLNLSGTGRLEVDTFDGTLTQTGGTLGRKIRPGDDLTITGGYNLTAGTVEFFFGGLVAGAPQERIVADTVTLGGASALEVISLTSLTPDLGTTFELITTTNGVTGTFGSVSLPIIDGLTGQLVYEANRVLLEVVEWQEGDFDFDGDVDGFDYLGWQRGESPNPLSAGDLSEWQTNYGTGLSLSASSSAVPEPSTLLLLLTAASLQFLPRMR